MKVLWANPPPQALERAVRDARLSTPRGAERSCSHHRRCSRRPRCRATRPSARSACMATSHVPEPHFFTPPV